jgi:hypothetical protein
VIYRGQAIDRTNEMTAMQTFFFDMKDGVPLRDRIRVEFDTNVEAIQHSRVLAQHFRDESLRDDQALRYPWSTRRDGKFIASSSTGKPAANKHATVREP